MKKLIIAVAYYRMSSDKQEASIPAQREAVEKYAATHGYTIIHEYIDEGISGDETAKRRQFQRLIADGQTGKFQAILCWDQDRFGRFNSLEAGFWIHPLMQAGVHLATVAQGFIDWNDFAGRMMYGIQAEAKHQYLIDLSRNVTRGMSRLAEQGKWPGGRTPIGYSLEQKQLVLGSETAVAFVRRMFTEYLAGKSLRGMADTFNTEGRLSPKGKKWTANGISGVLKNRVYVGDFIWNQRCESKYKRAIGRTNKVNDAAEWTVKENHHAPIVDRVTFAKVQEQLSARKTCSTPLPSGGGFVLSGVLRCEKCGYRMTGDLSNGVHSYTCYGYMQRGKNFCERHNVRQDVILAAVVDAIQEKYFNQRTLDRLAAECRKQLTAKGTATDATRLRSELAEVEAKLAKAKKRLVEVDVDLMDVVQEQVRTLRGKQEQINATLKAMRTPLASRRDEIDSKVASALASFTRLQEAVAKGDLDSLRQLVRGMFEKIEVSTTAIPWTAKRFKRQLSGGAAYLKTDSLLSTPR